MEREREGLWKKVVKSRHRVLSWMRGGARESERSGKELGWWGKVLALVDGREGRWFRDNLKQRLGNGSGLLFWEGA